jgi:hypothetical protein
MILILPSQALVLNAYAVLIGSTPGSTAFAAHQTYIAGSATASGLTGSAGAAAGASAYKMALNDLFASQTTAALATTMLANLGLSTAFTQAQAEAFLTANAANRVGAMMDLASQLYIYSGTDAGLVSAKSAYVAKVDASYDYSLANSNTQLIAGPVVVGKTYTLTTGVESLMGTAFNDIFVARTVNGANTLNDGDTIDGGAGTDTIYLDFVSVGNAITPVFKNIETVVVRAQSAGTDANGTGATDGNNQLNSQTVQIDAQRSLEVDAANKVTAATGVTQWESSNSRSDVIIEDVRIGNDQKTKDVTIAFRESDPGNVDFGVYFDQHSLRNSGTGSSSLTIQIMDTGAAASATPSVAATPLLNNPYDTFKIGINGVLQTISLNTTAAPATAANADTYAQLLAAFQAALLAAGGTATAALGAPFAVIDPLTGKSVTGTSIVITGGAGITFSDSIAGAGWVNSTGAAVPNSSNIFTTFNTGSVSVTELVTSKVILDDVGRGSTGGDLVIGGMSVGDTSLSRGVERFEITVEDSSKLQTINGTNNALREVTIVNGTTSNTTSAYNTVVPNAGNLTVNGRVATAGMTGDNALVGVNNARYSDHDVTGFTDVRLIDGSAMTGSLAFTAGITSDSIAKYITQVDTAANPFADVAGTGNINFNVPGANFVYTGGANNDTMTVTIDTAAVSSRSSVVSGLSDFTFNVDGGAGNDAITVTVLGANLAGGAQAWYNNQKLNANITIKGGAGNDTIRTPGAGDVIIDGGDGNDTIYTDNTGALVAAPNATGTAGSSALAYANAAAAELAAALNAAVAANATDAGATAATAAGFGAGAAAVITALNVLDNLTANASAADLTANAIVPAVPAALVITNGTLAAYTAGAITAAQKVAIDVAYNAVASEAITAPNATLALSTFVGVAPTGAINVAVGDAAVATILTSARTALANATAADTNAVTHRALLDATQIAVVDATMGVSRIASPATPASVTAAGLTAGLTNTVNGTIESAVITPVLAAGITTYIINGLTVTTAAGTTAADIQTTLATGVATGTATVGGADAGGYTRAIVGGTVTYTATTTGNKVDLTNGGNAAPVVTVTPGTDGTAAVVAGFTALQALLTAGTIGATATAGTADAIAVGGTVPVILTAGQKAQIDAVIAGGATADIDAGDVAAIQAIVAPLQTAAVTANTNAAAAVTANAATVAAGAAVTAGTAVVLAAFNTLEAALVLNATDASVVATANALVAAGALTQGQVNTVLAGVVLDATAFSAADVTATALALSPLKNAANNANTAAQTTLTNAIAANTTAVNAVSTAVAANTVGGTNGADNFGTAGTTAAAGAAATAATTAANALATENGVVAGLTALKAAITTATQQVQVINLLTNAEAAGFLTNAENLALVAAATVTSVTAVLTVGQKLILDSGLASATTGTGLAVAGSLDALIGTHTANAAQLAVVATNTAAISAATATAAAIATAAAASGANSSTLNAPKAVFVFDTSNQAATYNRVTMDDRNLADLKSDANDAYNFFNSTVKVTYKGIDVSMVVAGTNSKTTDLELNQAIKSAVNGDAVLSKLLLVTDGPANSLVVTSLIDGAHTTANLAVTVTMPTTAGANVAAAAAVYGLAVGSTDAAVVAAMATAKTAFDTKGDYTTQFAESGAANANVTLTGAASLSSSDNTITGGAGNDVIVLGTTVGTDLMTSSNESVVFSGSFGNDTIVNFMATGLGMDTLNFSALNGRGSAFGSLATDKSIVVGAATATPLTAAAIAALFTDSATAINHVYVAVDSTNIGSIWQVADAAGIAATGVVATLVGSIDLADTAWATLTGANFV